MGMNVCPICEAFLSYYTLYMGDLVPAYIRDYHQKKVRHTTNFEADLLYDQKYGDFLLGLTCTCTCRYSWENILSPFGNSPSYTVHSLLNLYQVFGKDHK